MLNNEVQSNNTKRPHYSELLNFAVVFRCVMGGYDKLSVLRTSFFLGGAKCLCSFRHKCLVFLVKNFHQ